MRKREENIVGVRIGSMVDLGIYFKVTFHHCVLDHCSHKNIDRYIETLILENFLDLQITIAHDFKSTITYMCKELMEIALRK